jgi:hypothetical protein
MRYLIQILASIFDRLESYWDSKWNHKFIGTVTVLTFVLSLGLIQLNIWGFLPSVVSGIVSTNHFEAIEVAFVLLLFFEIQSLVLVLPKSFSGSLLKQFEILSLILLRQAFKEFKYIEEPLIWNNISDGVYHMFSDALGALLIFGGILILKKLQKHRAFSENEDDRNRFIAIKKALSLSLILIFLYLTFDSILWFFGHRETTNFFGEFYTVLIFADIFLVLASLRYNSSYIILFRNSGFAFTTVMIRIALTSPVYIDTIVGVSSVLFAILLTYIYSSYSLEKQ